MGGSVMMLKPVFSSRGIHGDGGLNFALVEPSRRSDRTLALLLTTLAIVFAVHSTRAETLPSTPPTDSAETHSSDEVGQNQPEPYRYELAAGDRVLITVFDQPNLSGDFMIDGSGTLMLPLAGAVVAAGATVEELQARVVSRLSDGYLQAPVVNVRIVELRPIYVAGEVNASGSFPFRYGATVLSAIALSGGLKITPDAADLLRNDFLVAEERLKLLQVSHLALLVRQARLIAERDGFSDIPAPPIGNQPSDNLATLLAGERDALNFQRSAKEREIALLKEQIPRLEAEADALDEQVQQENNQIDILQSQIDDYQRLVGNGLARKASMLDLQREQAKSRVLLAGYLSSAAKARLSINDVQIKIEDSEQAYKRRVMTELHEVGLKLLEAEASLPIAQETRDLKLRLTHAPAERSDGSRMAVRITRLVSGTLTSFDADESTLLWPGDIVQVGGGLLERSPTDVSANSSSPLLSADTPSL